MLRQGSGEPRREWNQPCPWLNKTCFGDSAKVHLGSPPGFKGSRFHCSKTRVQRLQLSWQSPSYFHQMQFLALVCFPKAELPAVQTVPFLTPVSSCQSPADWWQRWSTAHRQGRFPHPHTILPAFVSVLGSHSPPSPAAALAGLRGLWLAEEQPCGSSPGLRSYFQDPEVLTNRDGLLQRTRQAPMGSDSSCPGPGGSNACKWSLFQTWIQWRKSHFVLVAAMKISAQEDMAVCRSYLKFCQRPWWWGDCGWMLATAQTSEKGKSPSRLPHFPLPPGGSEERHGGNRILVNWALGRETLWLDQAAGSGADFFSKSWPLIMVKMGQGPESRVQFPTGYRAASQGTWQAVGLSFSSFTCRKGSARLACWSAFGCTFLWVKHF